MDELRVGWIATDVFGHRIGLTLLPGRTDWSPAGHHRDLERDLSHLRGLGVGKAILLSDDEELERCRVPGFVAAAKTLSIDVVRRPIRDGRLPSHLALRETVEQMSYADADVVVMCRTGLGRSGLVGAAWLISKQGMTPERALTAVRNARPKVTFDRVGVQLLKRLYQQERQPYDQLDTATGQWWQLPGEELTLAAVPAVDDPWFPAINQFALSSNAYRYFGDLETIQALDVWARNAFSKTGALPPGLSLADLRALLFGHQRILKWGLDDLDQGAVLGVDYPSPDDLAYGQLLIAEIRALVRRRTYN